MCLESRDDFEVAIFCALPREADAVLDSFDQRYDKKGSRYGRQEEDTNTYPTGRIGRHNVVLAHMPGMGISSNLATMQEKKHTAEYPGTEQDRLFPASYRHRHRRETIWQGCLCTSSQSDSHTSCSEALESSCDTLGCVVDVPDSPSRQMRFASGAPTPSVHIDTVGSATTVMKSGEQRDAIARKNNIVAFDMEGAGVWDDFPCVIIKGVCDYADSHKNKIWHYYAAATAASAAKAFLDYWISRQHNIIRKEALPENGNSGSALKTASTSRKERRAQKDRMPSYQPYP